MLFKLAVARMSNPFKISYHVTFDPVRSRLGLILSVICTIQHLGIFRYYCRIIYFFYRIRLFCCPLKGVNQSRRDVLHMLSFRWQIINWDYQNYQIGKKWKNEFYRLINLGKMRRYKIIHIASSRESYDIHVHVYLIFS